MDAVSILLTIVSIISVGECFGMAYTARLYSKTIKEIPTMARNAAIEMLRNPEIKKELQTMLCDQEMFDAVSTSLWENFKNLISQKINGAQGKQTQEKNELAGLLQQDLNPLLGMLPDGKFKDKLMKNPQLMSAGLQILGPMLQSIMAGQQGGGGAVYGR